MLLEFENTASSQHVNVEPEYIDASPNKWDFCQVSFEVRNRSAFL